MTFQKNPPKILNQNFKVTYHLFEEAHKEENQIKRVIFASSVHAIDGDLSRKEDALKLHGNGIFDFKKNATMNVDNDS